jgi:hypothetical protein
MSVEKQSCEPERPRQLCRKEFLTKTYEYLQTSYVVRDRDAFIKLYDLPFTLLGMTLYLRAP